jgi:geranylgeranyl diphosphate synthase, type II
MPPSRTSIAERQGPRSRALGPGAPARPRVTLADRVDQLRATVDVRLGQLVPPATQPPRGLNEAVRYALLAPGKRLRPILTILSAQHFGAREEAVLDVACAIEMVHTASLVLDDLPAMDDAEVRRGRPTVHRAFGEDTALLAAIALLNQAFAVIARAQTLDATLRVELVARLADAIGFEGLVAGQMRDLRDRRWSPAAADLLEINHQKTGVLFVAAVEAGARAGGATGPALEAARAFATHLGLAFQIGDDLIDVTSSAQAAGKDVGKDAGRATLVSELGTGDARSRMRAHVATAVTSLSRVGPVDPLGRFAQLLFDARSAA